MDNSAELKRIMAIDFGLKRIGIALSDPLLTFSYPYKTIENSSKIFNELNKIIHEMNVKKIILGIPFEENGETIISRTIKKFRDDLIKKFNLEVILWDEHFTSEMAKENVKRVILKKSKRREKGIIDRGAAAIILQEYLDSQEEKPEGKIFSE